MKLLKQFAIIMGISFSAEIIRGIIPIPIPAGIYGMMILFILLQIKILRLEQVSDVGNFLIAIMGVMFVPAGVGIMKDYELLITMLPAIVVAVTVITIIVMGTSGSVTQFLLKKDKKKWK